MSRLNWNAIGERTYELGVDRGVLYIDDAPGVAWNGLISVSESPTGGEGKAYYIDGVKYMNRAKAEEFAATIEAYTYPDEFGACDGTAYLGHGLAATQQRRRPFGLVYRSRIGNDISGPNFAYKIHVVYNALAAPSENVHSTMSDELEPHNFSWNVTTKAPLVGGHRPTSHFVIDSRDTPAALLQKMEDMFYGTEDVEPRLPSARELVFWFTIYEESVFDGGDLNDPQYAIFDGGNPPSEIQTSTIDGGAP